MEAYFGCRLLMLVVSLSVYLQEYKSHVQGCERLTSVFGEDAYFEFNAPENAAYPGIFDINFKHKEKKLVSRIRKLNGNKGSYKAADTYSDRLDVEGNIKSVYNTPWNITITLSKVTEVDQGIYKLFSTPENSLDVCFNLTVIHAEVSIGLSPAESEYEVNAEEVLPDIECHVEPEYIVAEFTWTFDGQIIHNGSVLQLGVAAPGMGGEYTCVAHLTYLRQTRHKSVVISVNESAEVNLPVLVVVVPVLLFVVVFTVVICFRHRRNRQPQINTQPGFDHVRSNHQDSTNGPTEPYDNVDFYVNRN